MVGLADWQSLSAMQRNTIIASFLGWTLDAFDFFLLVFVLPEVAQTFNVGVKEISIALTLTLAMRPLGAFIFGRLADRFGRRLILMIDILLFSAFEVASAFAPNLAIFLLFRALFGIAMGGEWGAGASLAMESIPDKMRGLVSGILQSGYPCGYFLGALAYGIFFNWIGWRGLFVLGALPALLVWYIRRHVPESPLWIAAKQNGHHVPIFVILRQNWRRFLYMVLLMTAFTMFSHGSQDIYPTFLKLERSLQSHEISILVMIMNVGAIIGSLLFGITSEKIGRRYSIMIAALLSLGALPFWAYGHSLSTLILGAFLMQVMVQGAWGVVPAYLNELSPKNARATLPGFSYQLGNLLSSITPYWQTMLAQGHGFAFSLSLWMGIVAIVLLVLAFMGPEARRISFLDEPMH